LIITGHKILDLREKNISQNKMHNMLLKSNKNTECTGAVQTLET